LQLGIPCRFLLQLGECVWMQIADVVPRACNDVHLRSLQSIQRPCVIEGDESSGWQVATTAGRYLTAKDCSLDDRVCNPQDETVEPKFLFLDTIW
jgi:hypothetical protein